MNKNAPTIACTVAAFALVSCEALNDVRGALEGGERPSASIAGLRIASFDLEGLDLLADIEVDNPYATALPLAGVEYGLTSGGRSFLSGNADLDGTIPAQGSRTVEFPMGIRFADMLAILSDVRPGAIVPYEAALSLGVDAPVVGRLALPLSKSGELPVPSVPEISLESVDWGELSLQDASATLRVKLANTNDFGVDLERMSYALDLGGTSVATGKVARAASFASGESGVVEIPISLSPLKLGTAVFGMLKGDGSDYGLTGDLALGTPFGDVSWPYAKTGETIFTR